MLVNTPRTATAMALALSLVTPAAAQDRPACAAGVELPCLTNTGAVVETEAELQTYIEAFPEAAGDVPEAGGSEDGAEPQATPEATRTMEPGEEADVELPATGDAEEPPAADESAVDPEPVEREEPTEATVQEPAGGAADDAAAVDPEPVEREEPTDATVQEPAGGAADDAEMEATDAAPEGGAAAEGAEPRPVEEAATDAVPEGTVEADIPVVESEVPAAAAADDPAASGDVEETTVTEETSRSATEEFETAVGEEARPSGEEDGGDGLSTIQRVIAAGLAGAALGAITGQGGEVVSNTGDRLVVRDSEGDLRVLRDENALLRQPGARVRTENFDDGSTRTTVVREDGTEIVTIRAADGRVLRRTRVLPDGQRVVLFDDTRETMPVDVGALPAPQAAPMEYTGDEAALRAALAATLAEDLGRTFSLGQIREIRAVRELAPEIEIDAINFATGSAAIRPDQAEELAALGRTLAVMIDENPGEVFLVEGHTDAVGDASYNLALSDRRAETLALALSEFFDVPPENLVVQGYGESDLKIPTAGAEVQNRRANVRRITPLLGAETAQLR